MKFKKQTEHLNGFWLIEFELEPFQPFPVGFQLQINHHQLMLFQQNQKQLLFLSTSPIETAITKIPKSDLQQNWQLAPSNHFETETNYLIIASDQQIAAAFDLCHRLKNSHTLSVILHATDHFPFKVEPARFIWSDFPDEAIGASRLLEDWKIRNRLCCDQSQPGCYEGNLEALFEQWQIPNNWKVIDLNRLQEAG